MSLWWWPISGMWTSTCTTWRTPANASRRLTGRSWPLAVFLWPWVRERPRGKHACKCIMPFEGETYSREHFLSPLICPLPWQTRRSSERIFEAAPPAPWTPPVKPTAHLTYSSDVPPQSCIHFCRFRLTRAAPWLLPRRPVMLESSHWKRRACWTSDIMKASQICLSCRRWSHNCVPNPSSCCWEVSLPHSAHTVRSSFPLRQLSLPGAVRTAFLVGPTSKGVIRICMCTLYSVVLFHWKVVSWTPYVYFSNIDP